jgi:hypothetical protein
MIGGEEPFFCWSSHQVSCALRFVGVEPCTVLINNPNPPLFPRPTHPSLSDAHASLQPDATPLPLLGQPNPRVSWVFLPALHRFLQLSAPIEAPVLIDPLTVSFSISGVFQGRSGAATSSIQWRPLRDPAQLVRIFLVWSAVFAIGWVDWCIFELIFVVCSCRVQAGKGRRDGQELVQAWAPPRFVYRSHAPLNLYLCMDMVR